MYRPFETNKLNKTLTQHMALSLFSRWGETKRNQMNCINYVTAGQSERRGAGRGRGRVNMAQVEWIFGVSRRTAGSSLKSLIQAESNIHPNTVRSSLYSLVHRLLPPQFLSSSSLLPGAGSSSLLLRPHPSLHQNLHYFYPLRSLEIASSVPLGGSSPVFRRLIL